MVSKRTLRNYSSAREEAGALGTRLRLRASLGTTWHTVLEKQWSTLISVVKCNMIITKRSCDVTKKINATRLFIKNHFQENVGQSLTKPWQRK